MIYQLQLGLLVLLVLVERSERCLLLLNELHLPRFGHLFTLNLIILIVGEVVNAWSVVFFQKLLPRVITFC